MNLSHVLQFALSQTWAMEPGAHRRMMDILLRHETGLRLSKEEIAAATGRSLPQRAAEMRIEKNGVAVIPIHGVIAHRAGAVADISSNVGTSVEHIRADLANALTNESVQAIVLDVDSPGGSVSGIEELGAQIRAARATKPIVAHTEGLMASAGYWLAAQADKVFAAKGAEVGSIGVIAAFYDDHRRMANAGLDPIVIKSTPAKASMQSNGTMSDADRAEIQRTVDQFHELFVEAVAAGRGISRDAAAKLADGRVHLGADAAKLGLIDGVASLAFTTRTARGLARERSAAASRPGQIIHADGDPPCGYEWDKCATDFGPANFGGSADVKLPAGEVAAGAPEEAETMDPKTVNTGAAAPQPGPTGAVPPQVDGAIAENDRVMAILNASAAEQRDLAHKLIADKTPLVAALAALNDDLKARLSASKLAPSSSTAPLAPGNTAKVTPQPSASQAIDAMEEGPEKWHAQWKADKALRTEFEQLAKTTTHLSVRGDDGRPRAVTGLDLFLASMRNADKATVVSNRAQFDKEMAGATPFAED